MRKHLAIFTSKDAECIEDVFDEDDTGVEVDRGNTSLRLEMYVRLRSPLS